MSWKLDDDFEDPHHEDFLHKAREMESVLSGAGPGALAAMPGVEKVSRVWKSRSDGKRKSVEINVWFRDDTRSGAITFTGGKWLPECFGLGPSQLSFLVHRGLCGHCRNRGGKNVDEDMDRSEILGHQPVEQGLNPLALANNAPTSASSTPGGEPAAAVARPTSAPAATTMPGADSPGRYRDRT